MTKRRVIVQQDSVKVVGVAEANKKLRRGQRRWYWQTNIASLNSVAKHSSFTSPRNKWKAIRNCLSQIALQGSLPSTSAQDGNSALASAGRDPTGEDCYEDHEQVVDRDMKR